jgi:hypothetical protein
MKDYTELEIWLLFFSGGMFLISAAILLYVCALLLDVRHRINQWAWQPRVVRDDKGGWPPAKEGR